MKKIICCLFLIMLFCFNISYASTTLYQKENETKISSGTILKDYTIFTDEGWLNINVLEVDLKDKYTNIELLSSSEGTGKLKNVLSMAQESQVIAAINGDFFAGNSGKGHSIGLAINNKNILSSATNDNLTKDTFTSFLLTENNDVFFEYLTNEISLTSQKTDNTIKIQNINKYADDYSVPSIYTSDWGEYSIGSSDDLNLTEIVIENNKVIEIRSNEPAVQIPENGFVVSILGKNSDIINNNFSIGTKVNLEISFSPDIEDIEFAISGGAKLIENGNIPESFSHNITGKNPRTALGIDKNKEILYLITVDGRQESSIGMTQKELAEFLKSINIYTAINLDGGGSTTMVAQKLGDFSLSTINTPSGGVLRSVINAIGISSSAPASEKLYGLNIIIEDTNIFKNEEREIKVTGYNKYYNPVEIDSNDINWSYDGVKLKIENGKISGNTVGSSILTASIGKVKAQIEINILSDANELFITPKNSSISPNDKITYTIQAKNKNGYYAKTNLDTISAQIIEFYSDGIKQNYIPEDAKLENYTFTATTPGDYILSFSKNSITSYSLVSITTPHSITLDDFETETFNFDEYPDEVIGNATLSTEQVYSGKSSVKLEYDFNQDIQIRGAYIELAQPLPIPSNAISLSFWVYNDSYKDEKLKIKLKDSNGNIKLIVLEENLSHDGWKEINYNLNNISLPATISDIYLAQDNISIKNSGYIYIDNLIYYSNTTNSNSNINVPKDIKLEDQNNNNLTTSESFNIALIDTIEEPNLMIEDLKNKVLINSINKNADLTVITQSTNENFLNEIKTEKILSKGYNLSEKGNTTFITLDTSNNSIRTTDATQWINLQYDIKNSKNNNILLILNNSIDNFEDLNERKLFVDILCELKRETKKNITVLHTGFFTDYTMERGIKFLGINTKNIKAEDIASQSSYILISVTDNNISYEIKKIF